MIKIFSSMIKMCNAVEDDDELKQGGFFLKSFAVGFDCTSAGVKIFQPETRHLLTFNDDDDDNDDMTMMKIMIWTMMMMKMG